uniref:Uncharacterized protein n=1 Tax=viral metagenome TaxID=1070528 RepID=A0A6H1ZIC7_9ZZZZ
MKKLYALIQSSNYDMEEYGNDSWSAVVIAPKKNVSERLKNEIKRDNVLRKAGFDILSRKYRIMALSDIIEEKVNF